MFNQLRDTMIDSPICRLCNTPLEITFCDLGSTPLANSYLKTASQFDDEPWYPLHARVCSNCLLVQVDDVVPADEIFSDYAYFSSYSTSWLAHCKSFSERAIQRFALGSQSLVVEVASNDGYLLKNFVEAGIPVVGVEPAANVAAVAQSIGVRSDVSFFGVTTAERLVKEFAHADLVVANNVFAHVPDLNDFTAGFAVMLADEGVLSIECPHLLRLVLGMQFDTIYHEHYSYYSLHAAINVLERHGLRVFEVEELGTHGGSLRMLICKTKSRHQLDGSVEAVLEHERAIGLHNVATYSAFGEKVKGIQDGLREFLMAENVAGRTVVAYGAAAKGNTLLNSAGIDGDLISYVVDKNPHKQGHVLPGSHLEIHDPERLLADKPDTILILPWNIADEVIEQLAHARSWGASFVTAIAEVRLR
jgi:SAM-dependent methyltransferase